MDVIPTDMIAVIEALREQIPSMSQRRLQRRIRDEVNKLKADAGGSDEDADLETSIA